MSTPAASPYPCAITCNGAEEPKKAQASAIQWVSEQRQRTGGQVLLFVPRKGDLRTMDNLISRFAAVRGVCVAAWRTPASTWRGGPVLAAWPTRPKLAEIAEDPRTRALCVIPWIAGDVRAWELAATPQRLAGASERSKLPALHPVVIAGLTSLTALVNHGNRLAGALDRRDAIAVLQTLHGGGYDLPHDEVYAWAIMHGWPERGAARLGELAQKIGAGRRVRQNHPSPLRHDILEVWRSEAAETD